MSASSFKDGYWAEPRGRRTTELAPPSVNIFLTSAGSAVTRPGFEDSEWDLDKAGLSSEPLWISEYNLSFYAFPDALKFIDHDNGNAVYDTGITLTAASELSTYNGCVYVTNQTDGVKRIAISRLDAAALAAANTVFVEDGTTYRFAASGAGSIFINGTEETVTGRDDTDWKFTGMNLTQGYSSGAVVTQASSVSIDKFKKIVFWRECMHGIGANTSTSSQASKRALFFGDFSDAGNWKTVEDFSGGLSGVESVGRSGTLQNLIALENYLYLFTDSETYSIAVSGVDTTSGARPPQLFSPKYGTLNDKTAADMDGRIVFATQNNRIIRSRVNTGGNLEADEQFDAPMRNLLVNMDEDQSSALFFYWEEQNYLLCQLSIGGQILTLVYDNNPIITADGSSSGRWLPPVTNWQVKNYFTIDGKLYGTDLTDDTVYRFAVGQTDDGADIESVFATGLYEIDKGRTTADWGTFEVSGGLARGTVADFTPHISETDGKGKTFDSTGLDYGTTSAVGQVIVGQQTVGGMLNNVDFGSFDKSFRLAPAKGKSFQGVISTEGDGYSFRIDSWRLPKVKYYGKTLTTSV